MFKPVYQQVFAFTSGYGFGSHGYFGRAGYSEGGAAKHP